MWFNYTGLQRVGSLSWTIFCAWPHFRESSFNKGLNFIVFLFSLFPSTLSKWLPKKQTVYPKAKELCLCFATLFPSWQTKIMRPSKACLVMKLSIIPSGFGLNPTCPDIWMLFLLFNILEWTFGVPISRFLLSLKWNFSVLWALKCSSGPSFALSLSFSSTWPWGRLLSSWI